VTQAMSDDVPPLSAESILPSGKHCGETYGYVWANERKYCEWVKSRHKQLSMEWLSRFACFVEKADQSRMDSASVVVQDEDLVTQAMSDDVPPLSAESILPSGKHCGETYGYVWANERKYCEWVKSRHKQLSMEWLSRFACFVEKADQSRMDSASVATTHRQKLQRTRGK